MENPTVNAARLPGDPDANPRLRASCSQLYRLTIRPKPGTDAIRNLRRALKALGRYYHLDVVELRPVETKPRQTRSAVAERQERHKLTPRYSFFGQNRPRPPEGRPKVGEGY